MARRRGTADGRDMVTLHARGEAGKPPFHGLRTRGEVSLDARGERRISSVYHSLRLSP